MRNDVIESKLIKKINFGERVMFNLTSNNYKKSFSPFAGLKVLIFWTVFSALFTVGSAANANEQAISIKDDPIASYGEGNSITISYEATQSNLTGLGLRVHYDSSVITLDGFEDVFTSDAITLPSTTSFSDDQDYDNDSTTDAYFIANWASLFGVWPGSNSTDLFTVQFTIQEPEGEIPDNDSTPINFSASSTAAGYAFAGINYVLPITNDSDGDGCPDSVDIFPYDPTECYDNDGDGIGDNADPNDDNDIRNDDEDAFPFDSTEWEDTDGDGIGNNADIDDDNDGVPDEEDRDPLDPTIGRHTQNISVMGEPLGVIGTTTTVDIGYSTTDDQNQLPGLGFRIHFDSSFLSINDTLVHIDQDLIVDAEGPFFDEENYDGNAATDQYITLAWASVSGNWPNTDLPAKLLSVDFNVSEAIETDTATATTVAFSAISVSAGYDFDSTSFDMDVLAATWDFDGNGEVDALTDGLILLRYTFGLRGDTLTQDVMATNSPLTSSQVESEVVNALVIADIDANGDVDALTDGLLLLRYLFGLDGEPLVQGVTAYGAERSSADEVFDYITKYLPR